MELLVGKRITILPSYNYVNIIVELLVFISDFNILCCEIIRTNGLVVTSLPIDQLVPCSIPGSAMVFFCNRESFLGKYGLGFSVFQYCQYCPEETPAFC